MIQGPISSMQKPKEESGNLITFFTDPENRELVNRYHKLYAASSDELILKVKSAKENYGPDHPNVYEALEKLYEHYTSIANYAGQTPVLLEMLDFQERVNGKEHDKVRCVLIFLSINAQIVKDYLKQMEYLTRLFVDLATRYKDKGETDPSLYAWINASSGIANGRLGKTKEKALRLDNAANIYVNAPDEWIQAGFSSFKEDIIEIIDHIFARGLQGYQKKEYESAIRFLGKALSLYKLHLNPNDMKIAEASFTLGNAYFRVERYGAAIRYLKEALPIIQAFGNRKMIKDCKSTIATLENRMGLNESKVCVSCNMF